MARAATRYQGRIDAERTLGDVCILLREPERGGDGSCLVLAPDRGCGPANWMPGGSKITERPGGFIIEHSARGEVLEIFVDEVYSDEAVQPTLLGALHKLGAEREFSDLVAENLDLVEGPGRLELIAREWRTEAGPVDLLVRDVAADAPVIIELKRVKIVPSDVWQVRRYESSVAKVTDWAEQDVPLHARQMRTDVPVRGILIAPTLTKKAKPVIDDDPNLRFVRLSYQDVAVPDADSGS